MSASSSTNPGPSRVKRKASPIPLDTAKRMKTDSERQEYLHKIPDLLATPILDGAPTLVFHTVEMGTLQDTFRPFFFITLTPALIAASPLRLWHDNTLVHVTIHHGVEQDVTPSMIALFRLCTISNMHTISNHSAFPTDHLPSFFMVPIKRGSAIPSLLSNQRIYLVESIDMEELDAVKSWRAQRLSYIPLVELPPVLEDALIITENLSQNRFPRLFEKPMVQSSSTMSYLLPLNGCWKHPVSASSWNSLIFFPAIISQIALSASTTEVNNNCLDGLYYVPALVPCLVTPQANEDVNYDRHEYLGGGWYEYAVVVYEVCVNRTTGAGAKKLVKNKHLKSLMEKTQIPIHIQTRPLDLTNPFASYVTRPSIEIREGVPRFDGPQVFNTKTLPDVHESFPGALISTYSSPATATSPTFKLAKQMGFPFRVDSWDEVIVNGEARRIELRKEEPSAQRLRSAQLNFLQSLTPTLPIQSAEHELAHIFTYTETPTVTQETYDRIGQAALKFVTALYLLNEKAFGPLRIKDIMLMKNEILSNSAQASICVAHGLHDIIRNVPQDIRSEIEKFAALHKNDFKNDDPSIPFKEMLWRNGNVKAPEILCSLVRRYLGAILLTNSFGVEQGQIVHDSLIATKRKYWSAIPAVWEIHVHKATGIMSHERYCEMYDIAPVNVDAPANHAFRTSGPYRCDILFYETTLSNARGATPALARQSAVEEAIEYLKAHADALGEICECQRDD